MYFLTLQLYVSLFHFYILFILILYTLCFAINVKFIIRINAQKSSATIL